MKKTEETRQCTKLQNYIRAPQAQLSHHFFLSHPELFLFLPFSFLFNLILLMLVYLVYPGCVRHRVKMEEHKFKSQTLWKKRFVLPSTCARNRSNKYTAFFSLFFSINVHSYYCVLLVLPHSGAVEWNVRVSNFSLSVPNSTQCATLDTKLVMHGSYYLLME